MNYEKSKEHFNEANNHHNVRNNGGSTIISDFMWITLLRDLINFMAHVLKLVSIRARYIRYGRVRGVQLSFEF